MEGTVPARGRGERDATTKWRSLASQPAPRPTPAAGATFSPSPYDLPPVNLAGVLLRAAATTPDAPALLDEHGGRTTYRALADTAARLATQLGEDGVEPGDRVALVSPNGVAFVAAYLAALHAGAVCVPLHATSPPAELERQLAAVDVLADPRRGLVDAARPRGGACGARHRPRHAARRGGAARRPGRRRPRRPPLHVRHRRCAARRDAHARQPRGEHRAGPGPPRPRAAARRRRASPCCRARTSSG